MQLMDLSMREEVRELAGERNRRQAERTANRCGSERGTEGAYQRMTSRPGSGRGRALAISLLVRSSIRFRPVPLRGVSGIVPSAQRREDHFARYGIHRRADWRPEPDDSKFPCKRKFMKHGRTHGCTGAMGAPWARRRFPSCSEWDILAKTVS